ncbi:DUF4267 domain-containing protein [Chryseolinea soli]|uniref:DUF4267 domain-containing protein n=1 Tax=Chryseolinea soli TaxID=2321403 RepID=A0A385SNI8_9BACT|nr:DUF4267 domain-containing protein [Chryseolinea soli]AYB31505.1 DUF4267 domain-containing protein [Chryseolinea soli]
MKHIAKQTIFWISILSGIGLLCIGLRFFLDPLGAETDFGINTLTHGDFSFQYIKGARDFFFGLIILILLWQKEWRTLGLVLLPGAIIPAADFCIVLSQPGYTTSHLYPHLTAVIICLACGAYYLTHFKKANP